MPIPVVGLPSASEAAQLTRRSLGPRVETMEGGGRGAPLPTPLGVGGWMASHVAGHKRTRALWKMQGSYQRGGAERIYQARLSWSWTCWFGGGAAGWPAPPAPRCWCVRCSNIGPALAPLQVTYWLHEKLRVRMAQGGLDLPGERG